MEQHSRSIGTIPSVEIIDDTPSPETIVLNEPYLSTDFFMQGRMQVGYRIDVIQFASETYEGLPLYTIDLALEDGQSIQLHQRWRPAMAGTGPSNLVFGDVNILEGSVQQSDYWKLVYASGHHNWDEVFWVLFDPPFDDTYGVAIEGGEFLGDSAAQVYTLDEDFYPLRYIGVESITRDLVTAEPTPHSYTNRHTDADHSRPYPGLATIRLALNHADTPYNILTINSRRIPRFRRF